VDEDDDGDLLLGLGVDDEGLDGAVAVLDGDVLAMAGRGFEAGFGPVLCVGGEGEEQKEQKLYLFDAKKIMAPTFGAVRGKKLGEVVSAGSEGLRIHAQGGFVEVSRLRLGDGAKVKSTELDIPVGTILGG